MPNLPPPTAAYLLLASMVLTILGYAKLIIYRTMATRRRMPLSLYNAGWFWVGVSLMLDAFLLIFAAADAYQLILPPHIFVGLAEVVFILLLIAAYTHRCYSERELMLTRILAFTACCGAFAGTMLFRGLNILEAPLLVLLSYAASTAVLWLALGTVLPMPPARRS